MVCHEPPYIMPPERKKPTVYMELCICFDRDFPIEEISGIIGVHATQCGRKSDMRINPLISKQNPGYWEYHTQHHEDYSCESMILEMLDFLAKHRSALQHVKEAYKGEFFLRIMISAKGTCMPELRIPGDLIREADRLGAAIDVLTDQ